MCWMCWVQNIPVSIALASFYCFPLEKMGWWLALVGCPFFVGINQAFLLALVVTFGHDIDLSRLIQISKIRICCSIHTQSGVFPLSYLWYVQIVCILGVTDHPLWHVSCDSLAKDICLGIFCILGLLEQVCAPVSVIAIIQWVYRLYRLVAVHPLLKMLMVPEVLFGTCFHPRWGEAWSLVMLGWLYHFYFDCPNCWVTFLVLSVYPLVVNMNESCFVTLLMDLLVDTFLFFMQTLTTFPCNWITLIWLPDIPFYPLIYRDVRSFHISLA